MATSQQHRAPRFGVQVPVEFTNSVTNSGVTENLSQSGTLIQVTSGQPPINEELSIRFSFFLGSFATQFRGRVVRRTRNGFAIEFGGLDANHLEVLGRAMSPR